MLHVIMLIVAWFFEKYVIFNNYENERLHIFYRLEDKMDKVMAEKKGEVNRISEGAAARYKDYAIYQVINKELRYVTTWIGIIELVVFYIFTLIMIDSTKSNEEIVFTSMQVIAGWIALKIIGNHQRWGDPVYGRAMFFNFLIGSTISIAIAIGSAVLAHAISQYLEKMLL